MVIYAILFSKHCIAEMGMEPNTPNSNPF